MNAAGSTSRTEATAPSRRRWLHLVWGVPLVLVLLVAAAPYILARDPFRDLALGLIMTEANGTVTSSGARLGWFSPVAFYDVEISPPSGPPLLTFPACEGDTPLWRLVVGGGNLGAYRLAEPQIRLAVTEGGSNMKTVFAKEGGHVEKKPVADPARQLPGVSISVEIAGGTFVFGHHESAEEWTLGELNVTCQLQPSPKSGEGPRLVVLPGKLVDDVELTPELCNDMLSYAAPILSGVTRIGGKFSIEIDECELPLADLAGGKTSGTIEIHAVDVGPGRMTAQMADALAVPHMVSLSRESRVRFRQVDGRVYHRDLEFTLGELKIRTSGSVGLDESLELLAEIILPELEVTDAPLREALSGRTFAILIRGTLNRPEVDAQSIASSGVNLALDMVRELLDDETLSLDALRVRLQNRGWRTGADPAADPPTGRILPEGLLKDRPLLRQWFQNNRRNQTSPTSEASQTQTTGDDSDSLDAPQPAGPSRRLFNQRRRNQDAQKAEPAVQESRP